MTAPVARQYCNLNYTIEKAQRVTCTKVSIAIIKNRLNILLLIERFETSTEIKQLF
jgi:hypothetical protein